MLDFIEKYRSSNTTDQAAFKNVMTRANFLFENNNAEGLVDLIKILLRPIQDQHVRDAYLKPDHHAVNAIYCNEAFNFSDEETTQLIYDSVVHNESNYPTIKLGSDIVFTYILESK